MTQYLRAPIKSRAPKALPVVKNARVSSAKPKGLGYLDIHNVIHHKDDDDGVKLPAPTAAELHNVIHGHPEESKRTMGKNLRESLQAFRAMSECSGDAPVAGFNRHMRDMSPATRDLVLQARMPEIFAFAEDRRVDPGLVAGIAEATMRLGRIPDLGMYGLGGDVAVAVKHFLADTVLNIGEDEEIQKILIQAEVEGLHEGLNDGRSKHLKLAADYNKLADFHRRRAKEETDKAKMAKDNDRSHTEINARAAAERHTTLAKHCAGLADYHQLKANESSGTAAKPPAYPAADPKKIPPEPPQNPEKEKSPPTSEPKDRTEGLDSAIGGVMGSVAGAAIAGPAGKAVGGALGKQLGAKKIVKGATAAATGKAPALESTTQSSIGGVFKNLIAGSAFPSRMSSVLPMIERSAAKADYNKWGNKELIKRSGQDRPTDHPTDAPEDENDGVKKMESRFRKAETMEHLLEALKGKKKSKRRKATVDPEKKKGVLANVRTAPLFQDLGHKMDHACAKAENHKYSPNYSKELYNLCLKQGGGAAADKVVQNSLKQPWIREQGFVDEASNLRKKWETAMSQDALKSASPTEPEPVVFAVNNILRMSKK